jgi:hypothetical protein
MRSGVNGANVVNAGKADHHAGGAAAGGRRGRRRDDFTLPGVELVRGRLVFEEGGGLSGGPLDIERRGFRQLVEKRSEIVDGALAIRTVQLGGAGAMRAES